MALGRLRLPQDRLAKALNPQTLALLAPLGSQTVLGVLTDGGYGSWMRKQDAQGSVLLVAGSSKCERGHCGQSVQALLRTRQMSNGE